MALEDALLLDDIEKAEKHNRDYILRMVTGSLIAVTGLALTMVGSVLAGLDIVEDGAGWGIGVPGAAILVAAVACTVVYWWHEHSEPLERYSGRKWTGESPSDRVAEANRAYRRHVARG